MIHQHRLGLRWCFLIQGCTILIVTHDNRILDVADRIVELEDGRITRDFSQ